LQEEREELEELGELGVEREETKTIKHPWLEQIKNLSS
jgi:hypothetical protein